MKEYVDQQPISYDEIMNVAIVEIKELDGSIQFLAMGDDGTKSFGIGKSAEEAIEDLENKLVDAMEDEFTSFKMEADIYYN